MSLDVPFERWHRVRAAARNVLAGALTLVGIARVVAFYSGVFPLSVIGAQFGASPLPLVFSKVQGVETYGRRFAIDLVTTTKVHVIIPGDASLVTRIGGPFSRVKGYIDELAFSDLAPENRRQTVLKHTLCRPGPIPA